MKAIETKYLPATNFKGTRIKAYAEGGNSITVGRYHERLDQLDGEALEKNGGYKVKYLDSRNLQERIGELEELKGRLSDEGDPMNEEEQEELDNLVNLKEEVEADGEWDFGITFIPEEEFEDYAREFAEDVGAISNDAQWPATCIDWEQATKELEQDFTQIEYDGTTYLYR